VSIITISHDLYTHGREIAKLAAEKLEYDYVGPEVIQETCKKQYRSSFNLQKDLNAYPRFLDKIFPKKEQYLSMFRAAFFEHMLKEGVVYHGSAGHIFLADVPGVFKVRLTLDFEARVRELMKRQGVSESKAAGRIKREDAVRKAWTRRLYGKDQQDPGIYDVCINLNCIKKEAAVDIILEARKICTNGNLLHTRQRLQDLALEAKVEAKLLEVFPEVEVEVRNGEVFTRINASVIQAQMIQEKAKALLSKTEGITGLNLDVDVSPITPF
jgi:hypothetical protein